MILAIKEMASNRIGNQVRAATRIEKIVACHIKIVKRCDTVVNEIKVYSSFQ